MPSFASRNPRPRKSPPSYATPRDLVEALQHGRAGAREQLREWLAEPVAHLLESLQKKHGTDHDLALVTRNALAAVEGWLRSRPLETFSRANRAGFVGGVLVHVGKMAFQPHPAVPARASLDRSLPECRLYHSRAYSLPFEEIGRFRFGGDWHTGRHATDGALWLLVADVTGHGYYSHLLANGLQHLWQIAWERVDTVSANPSDLLAALHHLLAECLPEDVYVEATLARLAPDGRTLIAPGGGSRLLVRPRGAAVSTLRLRGGWLGLMPPKREEQHACQLGHGDELLLATDGLFDQLAEIEGELAGRLRKADLFEAVHEALQECLRRQPQKDDITMILVRRREPGEANGR